jgi:hypothetical protein
MEIKDNLKIAKEKFTHVHLTLLAYIKSQKVKDSKKLKELILKEKEFCTEYKKILTEIFLLISKK